jgi:hypothetical protein
MAEELMDLPLLQAGSAFPPTTFVELKIAILNRQRTPLLEAPPTLGRAEAVATRR